MFIEYFHGNGLGDEGLRRQKTWDIWETGFCFYPDLRLFITIPVRHNRFDVITVLTCRGICLHLSDAFPVLFVSGLKRRMNKYPRGKNRFGSQKIASERVAQILLFSDFVSLTKPRSASTAARRRLFVVGRVKLVDEATTLIEFIRNVRAVNTHTHEIAVTKQRTGGNITKYCKITRS